MATKDELMRKTAPVTVVRPTAAQITDDPIERVGIGARRGLDAAQSAATQAIDVVRKPLQGAIVGGLEARDSLVRGFTGNPTPMPGMAPSPASPANPAAPARPAAPAAPGVQFNTGQTTDVQPPTQPTIGSFTGSDGVRRDFTRNQVDALAGKLPTAPAAPIAPAGNPVINNAPALTRPTPTALAQGVSRGIRANTLTARNDAAAAMNPMSPQGEMLRRLENSQNSYFNKGSPSARAFAAEAILGQLRAGNGASAAGQAAANGALQQGAAGEVAAAAQERTIADGRDGRAQQALLTREALDAQAPTMNLANGQTGRVGRDGVVRTLVGQDGKPVEARPETKALDPNEVLKVVAAQQQAIMTDPTLTPEAKQAAMAELSQGPAAQSVAALLSSPQVASTSRPSLDQFLERAKAANPGASEADLRDYYNREYGSSQ